ncbi:MAG TPA: hypothetical protein VFW87_11895 [Pirellulales bacterium]|nr:hypothetical protein [Pirellulales bacterium]
MTPARFVEELAALMPRFDALAAIGVTTDDAERLRAAYLCSPRQNAVESMGSDSSIALVNGWDASRVEIGMVQFDARTSPSPLGTRIGVVEVDPLIVMSSTGEVVAVDCEKPTFVIWRVAQNSASFLNALLLAERFFIKRLFFKIAYEDFPAARAAATECAIAAGGEKYEDFYWMLLGAEP